jgi:hypothetical protein
MEKKAVFFLTRLVDLNALIKIVGNILFDFVVERLIFHDTP